MANITTCTICGHSYEESSEDTANAPERLCSACFRQRKINDYANAMISADRCRAPDPRHDCCVDGRPLRAGA